MLFVLLQKRLHDDDDDDENSENYRSMKRTKVINESNKENELIINRPSAVKRSRRGIGVSHELQKIVLFKLGK